VKLDGFGRLLYYAHACNFEYTVQFFFHHKICKTGFRIKNWTF
jgi:hypothetical protein